ncbi:hypothetical protein [Rhizobium ruizarguesonis]|uniref:hypothetical protein n=1 Tax=Rhizobium ruizarguesonis TaxID=2081791 RepID=UPI0003793C3F|nr:hypothetical protein [Rhizobium ruizarguesonis]TBC42722.1 hypothetical protein ELH31_02605 [Rhizobium ruizarguesonis]
METTTETETETELKDDILWGASAIAKEIGRGERTTFYMLERGELAAKKVCGRWVTTKRKLRRQLTGEPS